MSHSIALTFFCDSCGTEFLADDSIDIPPHWFAVQYAIADKEGFVPPQERDVFLHFCSLGCCIEFAKSDALKERSLTVDRKYDDDAE